MSKLTFKGFLTKYVQQLSYQNTTNMRKLAHEACTNNPRLREPLLLFAIYNNKQEAMLKELKRVEDEEFEYMQNSFLIKLPFPPTLYEEFKVLIATYTTDELTKIFESKLPYIRAEYHKVWNSYKCQKGGAESDRDSKEMVRRKVNRLMQEKKINSATVCKDLDLDPGNFSAWVSKGNNDRISLKTAKRVLEYLDNNPNSSTF